VIKTGNKEPSKSSSWKVLETVMSHLKGRLKVLEQDVKAGRMKKQQGKWLLEDRTKDKDFSYRLTGKDSRLILHGFMYSRESNLG